MHLSAAGLLRLPGFGDLAAVTQFSAAFAFLFRDAPGDKEPE